MIDYLDTDVAYLLGLMVTRGQIVDQPPLRRLVITSLPGEEAPGEYQATPPPGTLQKAAGQAQGKTLRLLFPDLRRHGLPADQPSPGVKIRESHMQETELYPEVMKWLSRVLRDRYPGYRQKVFDSSRIRLWRLIETEMLQKLFPMFPTYEIMVDVTAILRTSETALLGLVECKSKPITLRDIGQLWAYATVAKPEFALLISPAGISDAITTLLQVHQFYDLLQYGAGKRIRVASWDPQRREVIPKSVIPPGNIPT